MQRMRNGRWPRAWHSPNETHPIATSACAVAVYGMGRVGCDRKGMHGVVIGLHGHWTIGHNFAPQRQHSASSHQITVVLGLPQLLLQSTQDTNKLSFQRLGAELNSNTPHSRGHALSLAQQKAVL